LSSIKAQKFILIIFDVPLRMSHPLWYTLCMTVERDTAREAAKAEARVKRWNESVAKVQALQAAWQREELARNPDKVFLHKFEG
jgi:tRNA(Phe) wybutosine-synthesizing methylase Tyw3